MNRRGFFITLEGTDGVGKTTHAQKLIKWLRNQGKNVVHTREPGGSPLAEKIRSLLLNPKNSIEPRTELLLYEAARAEHVEKVILPALQKGRVVLCDRFTDATTAYQGFGRKLNRKMIEILNRIATNNLQPDLTLWLDLSAKEALGKAHARSGRKGDRLEQQGVAFQKRVRSGYAAAARAHPRRVIRVPVQPDPEKTQLRLRQIILRKLFK